MSIDDWLESYFDGMVGLVLIAVIALVTLAWWLA